MRMQSLEIGQQVKRRVQRRGTLPSEDKYAQRQSPKVGDREACPDDPGEHRYNPQGGPGEVGDRETPSGDQGSYQGKGQYDQARIPDARLQQQRPIPYRPPALITKNLSRVSPSQIGESVVLQTRQHPKGSHSQPKHQHPCSMHQEPPYPAPHTTTPYLA